VTDNRELRRYRAIIEYDGTAYQGFQVQAAGRTIQGELERTLERLSGEVVRVVGAGRTDAGVHARGQVIAFDSHWRHGPQELQQALNSTLPLDIAVRSVQVAAQGFHPRYDAVSRVYLYNLYQSQTRIPVLDRHYAWQRKALDLDAMAQAAALLLGEHDMAALGQATAGTATVRQVMQSCWRRIEGNAYLAAPQEAAVYQYVVEANGFLRGMVRRMVGCLLAVGEGRLSPTAFGEIIAARDISQSEPPAAACGLVLWQVSYPDSYPDGQGTPGNAGREPLARGGRSC
jgi:tRNA pseudouridine38-40 synthase